MQNQRARHRREWLLTKYPAFLEHQANKTANQFFPSLYEEYFAKWAPTPTGEDINEAEGDVAIATATVRQTEQNVRYFKLTNDDSWRANHGDHQ
jgi:hypothetical protein